MGATEALVVPYVFPSPPYHGKDGFNDLSFDAEPDVSKVKKESANDALHRIVRENPGKNISELRK